jgi:hypothetical protein
VSAACAVHDERDLVVRGDDGDLERERGDLRVRGRAGRARACMQRDRRAERAGCGDDRAGTGREETAKVRLGPARDATRIELHRDALELSALVPELRDAAADVEREFDVREPDDELHDVEALEARGARELDPETVLADRETERRDRPAAIDDGRIGLGRARAHLGMRGMRGSGGRVYARHAADRSNGKAFRATLLDAAGSLG